MVGAKSDNDYTFSAQGALHLRFSDFLTARPMSQPNFDDRDRLSKPIILSRSEVRDIKACFPVATRHINQYVLGIEYLVPQQSE